MLDLAIKHEDELKKEMVGIMFVEKYKFENVASYYNETIIRKDLVGWGGIQMVSVNKEGKVIGYFSVDLCRDTFNLSNLHIINFTDDKVLFAKDLKNFLMKLIEREDIRKLNFTVVIGNPIEKSYDKMIEKYGGRIIGIRREDTKLFDGKLYDTKSYEIFMESIRKLRNKAYKSH